MPLTSGAAFLDKGESMDRSFDASDMVQLPTIGVAGAIALGTELATQANAAGQLPAPIARAFLTLDVSHLALREAAKDRLPDASLLTSASVREADHTLDAAWSSAFDWSTGWSKLPLDANAAQVAIAHTLLVTLFSTGLKFTQIAFKLEWSESQTRLDLIDDEKLDASFAALGGEAFLTTIQSAHKAYGDALGLTKVKTEVPQPSLRDPLDAFLAALRIYVVRVSAHADPEEPGSAELVKKLLGPVTKWRSALAQSAAGEKAPAPAAGEAGGRRRRRVVRLSPPGPPTTTADALGSPRERGPGGAWVDRSA